MTDIIFPSILHVMCTIVQNSPPGIAVKRFSSGFPSAGRSPLALLEKKIKVQNPESHIGIGSSVKIKLLKKSKKISQEMVPF